MPIKAMIMSLGGSPTPLMKSLEEYHPPVVIFMASHDSIAMEGEVLKACPEKPTVRSEITEDPNSMFECYKAARSCVERVKEFGPEEVMIDYTGGTKVMSAALVLATAGYPFRFNYVGGDTRTKGGLGIVMDGNEKMFSEMSPWSVFAEEERRQVVTLFNKRRYAAVIQIIQDFNREAPHQIKQYLAFVSQISEGLLYWDQFDHVTALRKIEKGIESLTSYIAIYRDQSLADFLDNIERSRMRLAAIIERTEVMQRMDAILVTDLMNNARRRIADKRFDDAAARIYRALELYGQIAFCEITRVSNDKVAADVIPDSLRVEFTRKYQDPKSKHLKLPLEATFLFLHAKDHEAGKRYFQRHDEIRKVQNKRNYSILAHGIKPVNEKAIGTIFHTVADLVDFTEQYDFPQLPV